MMQQHISNSVQVVVYKHFDRVDQRSLAATHSSKIALISPVNFNIVSPPQIVKMLQEKLVASLRKQWEETKSDLLFGWQICFALKKLLTENTKTYLLTTFFAPLLGQSSMTGQNNFNIDVILLSVSQHFHSFYCFSFLYI